MGPLFNVGVDFVIIVGCLLAIPFVDPIRSVSLSAVALMLIYINTRRAR